MRLGLDIVNKEIETIIQDVHECLYSNQRDSWLLVYDGLDPEQIKKWLPHGLPNRPHHSKGLLGDVMISSRSPHWDEEQLITLTAWNLEEAMEYLRKFLPDKVLYPDAHAHALTLLVGCHPLGLTQVLAYIKYDPLKISIQAYIQLFERRRQEMLKQAPKNKTSFDGYDATIWTAVTLSLNAIQLIVSSEEGYASEEVRAAELALKCLAFACFLSPGFAPTILYQIYASHSSYDPEIPRAFGFSGRDFFPPGVR